MIETKQTPKLSRIPRGYWRNVWFIDRTVRTATRVVGPGEFMGKDKHTTAEIAEHLAKKQLAEQEVFRRLGVEWRRAEFFPEP